MFQNSFQNIERQKHYRNFWGDRSELWPSIFILQTTFFVMFYSIIHCRYHKIKREQAAVITSFAFVRYMGVRN